MPDVGKTAALTPELLAYVVGHSSPPDPLLDELVAETAALGSSAGMQLAPQQGALLTVLARLTGGRQLVEVDALLADSRVVTALLPIADGLTLAVRR
jgi:caffeoyl-CoA O-methyltransferase